MNYSVVILAAGIGARMRGTLPKVLYPIGGMSLLGRIVQTAMSLSPQKIVVVCGHQSQMVKEALKDWKQITWIHQEKQLGTGHAVQQTLSSLDTEKVLILNGDIPLISQSSLKKLLESAKENECALMTVKLQDPSGLGRIIRDHNGIFKGIVEEKDATLEQKQIKEICAGLYLFSKQHLSQWLPQLKTNNAQQELYITDTLKLAVNQGIKVKTVEPDHDYEVLGVNDKVQLAQIERIFQAKQAEHFMKQGLLLRDPSRFDLRGELSFGEDVEIDVNVILEGKVKLGNNVSIGPNVILKNTELHDGTKILANTMIEDAKIGPGCHIGPFARIRPGTSLGVNVRIGNFVEVKHSNIGSKTKVNHLSYIGDATIGQEVNIGAGTITCNYDGKEKHETIIGDHVFIGSDTQLIAPIKIGNGATIGAGTTVVRDVEPNELIHNRITHRSLIKTGTERLE